jgi:dTDP-4-dehydrorhamnose 3,5-epimerase
VAEIDCNTGSITPRGFGDTLVYAYDGENLTACHVRVLDDTQTAFRISTFYHSNFGYPDVIPACLDYMKEAGIDVHFVQDNQSMSTKGVLRGLHFQKKYPQCKLVRVVRGTVFDVAVDLRADSETYGKWYGVTLSAENKKQFLIPEGFAHGFLVLSDEAEFCYKVSDFWHPNDEGGLAWNDPTIGIDWHVRGEYRGSASADGCTLADGTPLNLSEKDQQWLGLKDTFKF